MAIGRALANEPPIIFADEPTASLDTERGMKVMALLRRDRAREALGGDRRDARPAHDRGLRQRLRDERRAPGAAALTSAEVSNLDDPRVLFAAERTLMAWSRTAAGLMAFGFVVDRTTMLLRDEGRARAFRAYGSAWLSSCSAWR